MKDLISNNNLTTQTFASIIEDVVAMNINNQLDYEIFIKELSMLFACRYINDSVGIER